MRGGSSVARHFPVADAGFDYDDEHIRDAVGHSNVNITSAYLHVAVDDEQGLGSLFEFER